MTIATEQTRILIALAPDGSRCATTIGADDAVPKRLYRNGRIYTTIMSMASSEERLWFAADWAASR
jgi:hypothetical protein